MAQPPHTRAAMRALYLVCQVVKLAAGYRDTTLDDRGHFLQGLLAELLANHGEGFALAVTQVYAPLDLMAQDAILRHQILVAQEQFLIDCSRDVRQQGLPIHTPCPLCLFRPPLASSMRDGIGSMQAEVGVIAGS